MDKQIFFLPIVAGLLIFLYTLADITKKWSFPSGNQFPEYYSVFLSNRTYAPAQMPPESTSLSSSMTNSTPDPGQVNSCSWDMMRWLYQQEDFFPGKGGHWELRRQGFSHDNYIFQKCPFPTAFPKPSVLLKCIQKNNWKKIVTIGDSNGIRYAKGFLQWIKSALKKCVLVKGEKPKDTFMPDVRYFVKGTNMSSQMFKIQRRTCHSCLSKYTLCSNPASKVSIALEHLAAPKVIDPAITTQGFDSSNSSQEYYFKIYLRNSMPDILFYEVPFVHEREYLPNETFKRTEELISLIDKYVPFRTKVIWIPMMTSSKFSDKIYHNMTIDELFSLLNHNLFDLIRKRILDPTSNWYGFYDLQSVTKPLKQLTKDGVHYDQVYYNVMMGHLLQLFCPS